MTHFDGDRTMSDTPGPTSVDALNAQPAQASLLQILMDGRSRTASELADATGITRPATSFHLARLVDGRWLRIDRQGRHRYFRLANQDVAGLLESMIFVSGNRQQIDERFGPRPTDLRRARMCYDHIAGELGVGIVESLTKTGALVETGDDFQLTAAGERYVLDLGIDVAAARRRRRHFARTCIDWSERRPHLAGALGAAIADRFVDLDWIRRQPGQRTLSITPTGQRELKAALGIDIQPF
jgi:DNA-binding transcriptional ArsR family regulator